MNSPTPTPRLDDDGHLDNLDDWSIEVASWLAEREGIVLTETHWLVINTLRDFYAAHEIAPAMRPFVKLVHRELGEELGNSIALLQLFPGSPARLAAKIGGLPRPTNCL